MHIIKLEGQLLWSSPPVGEYQENLAFRLQARFSDHPSTLIKDVGHFYRLEKVLNIDQLDARTFARCLEEFADEIRDMADEHNSCS